MAPPQALLYALGVIRTVAWKETRSYFASFMAYVLAFTTFWLTWQVWTLVVFYNSQNAVIHQAIAIIPQVYLFTLPLVTMRLFAEEKSTGTVELLLTGPVTEWQVVLGKYVGGMAIVMFMTFSTLHLPFLAARYGTIDFGPIKSVYLGTLLVGSAFLALGMFASSLTDSQVVAGFLTFGALVTQLFLGSWGPQTTSTLLGVEWAKVLPELSVFSHLETMSAGEVHAKDVFYYASFSFFFLYGTVKSLQSRNWR